MKKFIFVAALSFLCLAKAESPSCTFTNPAGTTRFQILEAGQFVEHTSQNIQTVYSCGPFVNDGSVKVTPATQIVELSSQSCGRVDYVSLTYVIYCH